MIFGSSQKIKRAAVFAASIIAAASILTVDSMSFISYAETATDLQTAAEERKSLPIQSNEIENWPDGPEVSSEAAIVMDINTGVILYAKNIHEQLYPASTTKIMTCLLAAENSALSDTVTFQPQTDKYGTFTLGYKVIVVNEELSDTYSITFNVCYKYCQTCESYNSENPSEYKCPTCITDSVDSNDDTFFIDGQASDRCFSKDEVR